MATVDLLMNERFVSTVMNSWKANLKSSSENDLLFFNSALRKKRWSLTVLHIFTLQRIL